MSGWQAGDIAVCIEDCNFRDDRCEIAARVPSIYYALAPKRGDKFVVDSVEVRRFPEGYEVPEAVYLVLREAPGNVSYLASLFRKVTPPPEMIAEERKVEVPA